MNWPHFQERVTVADVLEVGACIKGVKEWIENHNFIIEGYVKDFPNEEFILMASCASGYGYGYGYGYGDGK